MWHSVRRIVTTLWALWFVLLVSEPALLHVCPMHDGAAMASGEHASHGTHAVATAAEQSHDAHAAHSGHDAGHVMPAAASSDETPAENSQHGCSCLGDCATTGATVVPDAPRWAWLAGIIDVESREIAEVQAPRASFDYLLPFGNGPPVTARA